MITLRRVLINLCLFVHFFIDKRCTLVYNRIKIIQRTGGVLMAAGTVRAKKKTAAAVTADQQVHSEVALALASAYDIIYLVDIKTGKFIKYSESKRFEKLGMTENSGDDFYEIASQIANKAIHREDRQKLLALTNKETMLSELEKNGSVSLTYRQVLDGKEAYLNMLALVPGNDPQHFVVAVRNVDAQVRREKEMQKATATYSRIAMSLASRYETIYDIDIETGEYIEYDSNKNYGELGINIRGEDFFSSAQQDIRASIHPDDLDKMLKELKRDLLLENLRNNGSLSLTFRQRIGDGYQFVSLLAVQPKNDDKHILIGVLNIDSQEKRVRKIQQESEKFSRVIRALASHFEVIYYVDIGTDAYEQYSASKSWDELNISKKGDNFFDDSLTNIRRDVYEEDYPVLAAAMQKENFLECLGTNGTFTLKYRLMLDGRPQFVSLFAVRTDDDPQHVIIAIVNIDTVTRKEIAITEARDSAIDMMNHDPLTGLLSKHAYDKKVSELEQQILDDEAEFSLVVADVNELKVVNDSQGHSAGDKQIMAAGRLISGVFRKCPVYRIGGDEFVLILQGQDHERREEFMAELEEKNRHNRQQGKVTVSAGIAVYDELRDTDYGEVFEKADRAMYREKRRSKKQD